MSTRYGLNACIPEGKSGSFQIKHQPAENGTDYTETCLYHHDTMIMSDRPIEYDLHSNVWQNQFFGKLLVCGLGLGYVHNYFISQKNVEKIIVIEKNQDVIDLVWDYCNKDNRFELIHTDAETWEPTESFDFGWFDSWIPSNNMTYDSWVEYMTVKYKDICNELMFWKDANDGEANDS